MRKHFPPNNKLGIPFFEFFFHHMQRLENKTVWERCVRKTAISCFLYAVMKMHFDVLIVHYNTESV